MQLQNGSVGEELQHTQRRLELAQQQQQQALPKAAKPGAVQEQPSLSVQVSRMMCMARTHICDKWLPVQVTQPGQEATMGLPAPSMLHEAQVPYQCAV